MMLWLLLKFVLIWAKETNKLLNLVSTTFPFPKIVFRQLQEFYFRNVKYDILTEIYRCTEILMKICSFPVPLFFILGMNTDLWMSDCESPLSFQIWENTEWKKSVFTSFRSTHLGWRSWSKKILKIYRKAAVMESFLSKVGGKVELF